jgi:hypothetical protein
MPRSSYDDDDDLPRLSRRRLDDDDLDDRPRARSRYDDDDDDYLPSRRTKSDSGAMPMIIVGIVIGAVILLGGLGGVVYLLRAQAAPQPAQANFAAQQPANPPPVFIPPGVPKDVLPPELARKCVISNLRLANNGFGGRGALTFDCEFPGGRPFGGERFVAVVTEPGKQPATANLFGLIDAKNSVSIDYFGGFGTFPRGTTVYIAKGFGIGPNAVPKPISNTLALQ